MQQKNNSNLVMVYELEYLFRLLNRIVFVVFCCIAILGPNTAIIVYSTNGFLSNKEPFLVLPY